MTEPMVELPLARAQFLRDEIARLRAALAEAEARTTKLAEALDRYGEHDFGCSDRRSYDRSLPCLCGYDNALRALAGGGVP